MTEGTCVVGIRVSFRHGIAEYRGHMMFRAAGVACEEEPYPWRRSQVEAEVDALRMDGHRCAARVSELNARVVPRDRVRTQGRALLSPESALRYLPHRQ